MVNPVELAATGLQPLQQTPVTAPRIKIWTIIHPVLAEIRNSVFNGWPVSAGEEVQPSSDTS